jgi:mono/diheme cytochrome c family protein
VEVNSFKSSRRLRSAVSLVLAGSTFTMGNLQAQEVGNPAQGLRIAQAICAECHLVDKLPGEQSPNLIAPTFERIANTPGMNSAALTAALRTSHEIMPNIIITGSDLSDVIAYVLSLRKGQ